MREKQIFNLQLLLFLDGEIFVFRKIKLAEKQIIGIRGEIQFHLDGDEWDGDFKICLF